MANRRRRKETLVEGIITDIIPYETKGGEVGRYAVVETTEVPLRMITFTINRKVWQGGIIEPFKDSKVLLAGLYETKNGLRAARAYPKVG